MSSVHKEDSNRTSESCRREQTLLLMIQGTQLVTQLPSAPEMHQRWLWSVHSTFLHGAEKISRGNLKLGKRGTVKQLIVA